MYLIPSTRKVEKEERAIEALCYAAAPVIMPMPDNCVDNLCLSVS